MKRYNHAYFYITFLLAFSPHVAEIPLWATATVLIITAWAYFSMKIQKIPYAPSWLIVVGSLAVTVKIFFQFHTLLGPEPATPLLLVLASMKLHELKKHRDALIFLFLCLLTVMFALLFSQTLAMTLYMILMTIFVAIGGMILNSPPNRIKEVLKTSPKLVSLDLLLCLPLFLLFFFLFPRFQTPWSQYSTQTKTDQVGFTDEVAPEDMARLAQSDDPAFHVSFSGAPPKPAQLYWRGLVLTSVNGWRWKQKPKKNNAPTAVIKNAFTLTDYTLTLEPKFEKNIFTLDSPIEIISSSPTNNRIVQLNYGQFQRTWPAGLQTVYRGKSQLDRHDQTTLSAFEREENLQLPKSNSEKLIKWVEQIKKNNPQPKDQINAVLNFFSDQGFQYSLVTPAIPTLDDFLFKEKIGFCEHYASSFSTVMRLLGQPAHVVVGFHGGELNDFSDFILVRDKNAHAWSEVWLEGEGWIRIDPTASVNRMLIESGSAALNGSSSTNWMSYAVARTSLLIDAINMKYSNFLLNYNTESQSALLSFQFLNLKRWHLYLTLTILTFLFLYLTQIKFKKKDSVITEIQKNYLLLCENFEKHGLKRNQFEGPLHFYERSFQRWPDKKNLLEEIFKQYIDWHYGSQKPKPNQIKIWRKSIRQIEF